MNVFIETIVTADAEKRNRSFFSLASGMSAHALLQALKELEHFRKQTDNLYEKVRAILFLYAGFRFFLSADNQNATTGHIPFKGFEDILSRRYENANTLFWQQIEQGNGNAALFSAMAESYHQLSFQILANQVRKSVRSSKGNQWMFRVGNLQEHAIAIHPALLIKNEDSLLYPLLHESTPVRMDLTHSAWSDIFFLGMDYPEGARVINVSINLGVYQRDDSVNPPLHAYVRVIPEPLIRVTSIDLNTTKDISELDDLFNFGNDYLSLVKAGIIASGLVPVSFEGTHQSLPALLSRIVAPGMGIEVVTKVNDIPKGSRFAVSTNLLGCIISLLMRATGQTKQLEGGLLEEERRLVASRAILGEWIGGSGGGWQDSGGVWPGIKSICGMLAESGDPEFGISRGTLLPKHTLLTEKDIHPDTANHLMQSLVLMHGGMASNVGPVLEMVTEKYLLRGAAEWQARQQTNRIFDNIVSALHEGDIKKLAAATAENFDHCIKNIIPGASNYYTEQLISKAKAMFGEDYYGFLMLGGVSGGGMGMFVNPAKYEASKQMMLEMLTATRHALKEALPFAVQPVVYDWNINTNGTWSELLYQEKALMPDQYYGIHASELVRKDPSAISYLRRAEIDLFTLRCKDNAQAYPLLRTIVSNLFKVSDPAQQGNRNQEHQLAADIKKANGFDFIQHEEIREQLQKGKIGLSRNRLPASTVIADVAHDDIQHYDVNTPLRAIGESAIKAGKVAVMSLAAGVGSRWTKGAGVIKAINPFVMYAGRHRSFLEIHLSKTQKVADAYHTQVPHIIATSYLTHRAIATALNETSNYGNRVPVFLSPGRSIGQRFIPTERDLRFLWEEMPQETLDENKQKVRDAVRSSLIHWAKNKGEAADYTDNIAAQRFSPLGHWYEVPNLIRNGVLAKMLRQYPALETIMLHNIDTLGADVDPVALGNHLQSGKMLTFEVIARRIEDRGGGLANVNGSLRMLEGLAQPNEADEWKLSYYNSNTTWIQIDDLLALFGFNRATLMQATEEQLAAAVRNVAHKMPTYVTIKEVKYRWGHGQEDIYPVAQIEKLWTDMTALNEVSCNYLEVPRLRGQQLKDPAQLDAWITDGSCSYVEQLCTF